ncbi:hypothetical protein K6119_11285 [Paracrocinitomix mangrovi]|uniref:GldM family protein n=1 Tax=Paracrocinitomix mangrovi TaxID=2862509 RepID=UPI001C8D9DE6|nr:GldM family protein [Paracrocinitomix mangrovi]UKN00317.1 hypothetical protein K6119_11285 [Paracrocinitomix mangrovi]
MPKFTLLVGLLLILSGKSLACSCETRSKVKEEMEQAEYVVYGKVLDVTFVPGYYFHELITKDSSEIHKEDQPPNAEFLKATFVITHTFKGKSELDTITVYTDESERSCGVAFQAGEEYVIYGWSREYLVERYNHIWHPLEEPEEIGSIWTNLCTRTTKEVRSELAQLEAYFTENRTTQVERYRSTISLTENRILFWNVKNPVEFVGPAKYDSLTILVNGGEFYSTGSSTGYIIPTKKEMRSIKVDVIGFLNGQKESLLAFDYKVLRLPDPSIYIGNFDLTSDLNRLNDQSLFQEFRFTARYDYTTNYLIGITDCNFSIKKWTIQVGKQEIVGSNKADYDQLFIAITNAKKGTEIRFQSFEIAGPDGAMRTIDVNTTYLKKGKKNEVIKRNFWSLSPSE